MLVAAFNTSWACCLRIGVVYLIHKGKGVVPPPIVHLIARLVKHLSNVWGDRCTPLQKLRTPAAAVGPHPLELWNVVSHDWLKKDYIMQEVPVPCILDPTIIVYPDESNVVFWDEYLYTVPLQWQVSICNRCQHFSPSSCHPLSFAAALCCHRCELKMNLHLSVSYRVQSELEAVAMSTGCGVYTLINGLQQSQHPSIRSIRHDASCICKGQISEALDIEQMAIYKSKRLAKGKLCNGIHCKSISWSPTLANNRDVLEHHYAAKQHLVQSIQGMPNGDLQTGMLNQRPTADITHSNRYHVRAQLYKV